MNRLLTLTCAFVVVTPLAASDAITVTASIAQRIVDGTEIKAVAAVEATGASEVSLPAPTPHLTLRPAVEQLRDDNQRRCFSDAEQVISGTPSTVTIRRGSPLRVSVDLLEFYPLGLSPGRYALTFVMDTGNAVSGPTRLRSEPVEFEVVAPQGTDRAKWEEFRKICSAVIARRPAASADALAFARKHGDYPLLRVC